MRGVERGMDEDKGLTQQQEHEIAVRINGVLPRVQALGDERQSDRAAEVKSSCKFANTSCSIIISNYKENGAADRAFHILVDAGGGVLESMKGGLSETGIITETTIPDIILITNAHEDRVKDLPAIVSEAASLSTRKLKVMCTKECIDQVLRKYPSLANNQALSFEPVKPGGEHTVGGGEGGALSITPVAAENGGAEVPSEPGAAIYIVKIGDVKIITAWDFISLPGADITNLLWNPDLLVIGAETYNDHPSIGSISVADAYRLIRKWNATNSFIVHYGGLKDFEDAKNQWFRGPTKAMTTSELQRTIDSYLQIAGQEGKFKITVAKEGLVWRPERDNNSGHDYEEEEIGRIIEIISLQKYVLYLEKVDNKRLKLTVEDNVNRLLQEFVNPRTVGNDETLQADPVKSMFMKGPELKMEVVPASRDHALLRTRITQGRKVILQDDIQIAPKDATRLIKYFGENFGSSN
jgi:hypothetical protein